MCVCVCIIHILVGPHFATSSQLLWSNVVNVLLYEIWFEHD